MTNYYGVSEEKRKQIKGALYVERIGHQTLANELGLSRVQVTKILNGKSNTTFGNWQHFAKRARQRFTLDDLEGLPEVAE